jgi:molybdopterin molybdotransferase
MIPVNEAKELVRKNTAVLEQVHMPLPQASGLVLAADIYAENNFPPFEQAAMDGYAFFFDDLTGSSTLEIKGESAAGNAKQQAAGKNEAVRIFTGAPLPQRTDTVVMQEKVEVNGNTLVILDKQLTKESNVRPTGSEIVSGSLALAAGTLLTPGAIGFLSGLGRTEVPVYRKPRIHILVTGNELQDPGKPLAFGQVYESNSFALRAALEQMKLDHIFVTRVHDHLPDLKNILEISLENADLVLITGGISVGDYDFAAKALGECGVEKIFHSVKQKPGKPLYFGTRGSVLVFGLPGNPSSVLTCFYEYVLESIEGMMGMKEHYIKKMHLPLTKTFVKKPGLTHFLKAVYHEGRVTPLDAQESYKMRSFALANCLIVLPEEKNEFEINETVEVHALSL